MPIYCPLMTPQLKLINWKFFSSRFNLFPSPPSINACHPLKYFTNMRGGGGGGGHMPFQYHQKPLLEDDHDPKTFCFYTPTNDEEDHVSHSCEDHHDSNVYALNGDDCSNYEPFNLNERTLYWESQEALLQEILEQYSSNGSKLREELIRLIELTKNTKFCECPGPNVDGCSKCLRRGIVNLLCKKGFNASLCTSIWKKTHSIPGGRHEYIDVIASSQGKKRKIRFLIEIQFRDEFKMAKACDEYGKLIDQLPETYIGKPEHLNAIVRVICDAAKRSTAERKIHLGPWRKKGFMQMKWSASSESRHMHQSSSSAANKLGLMQKNTEEVGSNFPPPSTTTAVRVA